MTASNTTKRSGVRDGHQQFHNTISCPVFDGVAGSDLWFTCPLSLLPTLQELTRPAISLRAPRPHPTRLPSSLLNPMAVVYPPYPAPVLSATRRSSSTSGEEMTEIGHDVTGLCARSGGMDESLSCGNTGSIQKESLQPGGR